MAAARLGCKSSMVGPGLASFRPGCMCRPRKCYLSEIVDNFSGVELCA